MKMKYNKKYYLSLPYKEKINLLQRLVDVGDFNSYSVIAAYGGIEPSLLNKEFERSMKRKHFLSAKKDKTLKLN
tara:strand:+ start:2504 stop:2725 length:222 start_codon:yes stop_codon:yes gene_type:complete